LEICYGALTIALYSLLYLFLWLWL